MHEHGYSFTPAIFSHTGQVRQTVMVFMLNQIKCKMELVNPDVHASKAQCMLNLWVKELSSVINRAACMSIIAGAASLVDSVNAALSVLSSSFLINRKKRKSLFHFSFSLGAKTWIYTLDNLKTRGAHPQKLLLKLRRGGANPFRRDSRRRQEPTPGNQTGRKLVNNH